MKTAAKIETIGRRAVAIRGDVSKKDDVNKIVGKVVEEFGRVDILVNNAAILGPIGLMVDNDPEYWIETIKTNLVGTFLCCKTVLPSMMKQRKGKIINLSGGGAANPRPRFSAYSASKAAVVRLTETLAHEVKEYNIQVNALAPGAVNTRLLEEALSRGHESTAALAEKKRDTKGVDSDVPAALAVFLASDRSDALTGRLISAVRDDWRTIAELIPNIMCTDAYTLRRIDPMKK
jgi:NAD(P)-dependent dehydrogenase (short-subunit alcohol dehydrogenase family)